MIVYFVRHGEPDYETDSLTEEGRRQAELVSRRLMKSGVDALYSSPLGRARETAVPTAEKSGLPVEILPWAYELSKESKTTMFTEQPTHLSWINGTYWMQPAFRNGTHEEFFELEAVQKSGFKDRYHMIAEGLDAWLKDLGYERTEEGFYMPVRPNDKHVVLFCHAAMMRVLIAHLMNMPYQYVNFPFIGNFTGITTFSFHELKRVGTDEEGNHFTSLSTEDVEPLVPRMISYGDVGHMYVDEEAPPMKNYSTGETF